MASPTSSPTWRPREVSFRHPAPDDVTHHEGFFRCPIRWSAEVAGVVMSHEALDAPTVRGDGPLRNFLGQQVDALLATAPAVRWRDRLRQVCLELFTTGMPSGAKLARRLGTTERTLRRRLAEEGTSLRACIAEIQHELAVRYLGESISVEEVAYLTGFNDASAFRRAFRRWTGTTPGQQLAKRAS